MAKKLICFPFINGNLQEYSFNNLDDDERERVYNGEEVIKGSNKKEIWKPNEEVELTLHYERFCRGRSAVTFYWIDDDGHEYPMFIKDVDELLKQDMGTSSVHAIFTYVKRGANYGIKFLRRVEDNNLQIKESIQKLADSIPLSTKEKHQFETEIDEIINAFAKIGVALTDDNGEYRFTGDVLHDLAEKWNDLKT